MLFLLSFDRWMILLVECEHIKLMAFDGHQFIMDVMIDYRYYQSKRKYLLPLDRYFQWSACPVVSIDSIGIDTLPINPSSAPE
jgi:hypothetical protein